jgi:hypothetical protein
MTTLLASRRIVPRYPVGATFSGFISVFAALARYLDRFFASVAASQNIVRHHEDGLSRLPDHVLAAHGLDREEIRRDIENSRIGF